MSDHDKHDGIHGMVPREKMSPEARKLRDTYAITPGLPLVRQEFGFYSFPRWVEEGLGDVVDISDIKERKPDPFSWSALDPEFQELFQIEDPGEYAILGLGWCEAAFHPVFEEKLIEDRGDYELVQDFAGRHVVFFKNRRTGFMPEYEDHPVKDWKTWEENVKWRLDPNADGRFDYLEHHMAEAREAAGQGKFISQRVIGGYMYLRSLIGPADLLFKLCEDPDLIHNCMETWCQLADAVLARHQEHVTFDEIFFAEDICYNRGCLISPDMMHEFLFPYYKRVLDNAKKRQIDPDRHLHVHVDTDGDANPVIPLYQEAIGMDFMSPFEVASGCDVVEIGNRYPKLGMLGGIDKRVLATDKAAIDKYLERVIPPLRERGGYIPTCDHGVPPEVSLDNYLHYRQRCVELGG